MLQLRLVFPGLPFELEGLTRERFEHRHTLASNGGLLQNFRAARLQRTGSSSHKVRATFTRAIRML